MKGNVIICVDDEDMVLRSLKRELNETFNDSYLIEIAEDGKEALTIFTELLEEGYGIPLVISDHIMPGMKGDELLQRIHAISPKTLKIMLTGQADIEAVANAVNYAKLYQYIAKPWEKAHLSLTVKEALRSYFQDRELEEQRVNLQRMNVELEQLNAAYARFVPREFLRFLNKSSILDLQLGDHVEQDLSIVFADIRRFTSLSEQMTPKETFQFINTYLGYMSPMIHQHHGVIDKYIGDAIMALFPRCADDALQSAIAMLQTLGAYNRIRHEHGETAIRIGIGMNTGSSMLGIIGEQDRMESTVIADAVNLASRLEGLTKRFQVSILMSEYTYAQLKHPERYHIRFLGKVQVKGKQQPVQIYEVYDEDAPEILECKQRTQADFEQGVQHYLAQEFTHAIHCFTQVFTVNPHDKAAHVYLERCRRYAKHDVPEDWQGLEVPEYLN